SSARPAPGHGRCRRFRYRAARGPADRAAVPTASAARPGSRSRFRKSVARSFDFKAGAALLTGAAFVAEAGHQMVVDHAGGLHEGIDDGRPDELETARRKFP